ncbi:MAG: hypothetical protein FWC64_13180 [Treponema sp.]|nr:hypothetical protein [Treponema sp.]
MGFLEGPFGMSAEVKNLLLSTSPSTIDRVLRAEKKKLALKGKSGTKQGNLLKKHISIRVYFADGDKKPGFFEIDTVHHCGGSDSGEFLLTLTALMALNEKRNLGVGQSLAVAALQAV